MRTDSLLAFLESLDLLPEQMDMDALLGRMVQYMEKGLTQSHSYDSLPMIPSFIAPASTIPHDEEVIVMAAGQDELSICFVRFDEEGKASIREMKTSPMPGSYGEISKDRFYQALADALLPFLSTSKRLGISFSYECEMQENGDGKIVNLSKEIRAPGLIGSYFIQSLKEALVQKNFHEEVQMVLLNNTVATVLAGLTLAKDEHFASYASLILDSGMNAAYIEDVEKLTKLHLSQAEKDKQAKQMIVNIEAGSYPFDARSVIDEDIDLSTNTPGDHTFEKILAGKYQALQVQYIVQEAIDRNLIFSGYFADRFEDIGDLEEVDIHEFYEYPLGPSILGQCCANDLDREHLYHIIDAVLERVACLLSILLCAIHVISGKGKSPMRALAVALEKDTYYAKKVNRVKLDYYRTQFVQNRHGFYDYLIEVENANIVGTAVAALGK